MKQEYKQHIEEKYREWLDNSNLEDLGIVKWAKDLLPEYVNLKTPKFHLTIYAMFLSLFDPIYTNKYQRLLNIIVFREGAKSTLANKIFVPYLLANNGQKTKIRRIRFKLKNNIIESIEPTDEVIEVEIKLKLVVLASETATQSESIVTDVRNEFQTNRLLKYYYRFVIQDAIDDDTGQWTKQAFKLNNCYFLGVGAKQQIRGKIRGASRPDLIIFDDIYSEKNITDYQLDAINKRWFENAAMNSLDVLNGKAIVINTILHENTMPVILKSDRNWKTYEIPVMPIDKFERFVREHLTIDRSRGICTLPFDEIEDEFERIEKQQNYFRELEEKENWELQWREKIGLYFLALKYASAVRIFNTSGFYQEFFHKILSPDDQKIRQEHIIYLKSYELENKYGMNWIRLNGSEELLPINIEFGVDLAAMGDESVISPVGCLSDGRKIVFPQVAGRFNLRDELRDGLKQSANGWLNRVCLNRDVIEKIGVIDEIFRQYLIYKPSKIKIGTAGEEKNIVTLIRQLFESQHIYDCVITSRPQTIREGNKIQRISDGLTSYFQSRSVLFTDEQPELINQLVNLGKTKHDDRADALEVAFWQIEKAYNIAIDEIKDDDDWGIEYENRNSSIKEWRIL